MREASCCWISRLGLVVCCALACASSWLTFRCKVLIFAASACFLACVLAMAPHTSFGAIEAEICCAAAAIFAGRAACCWARTRLFTVSVREASCCWISRLGVVVAELCRIVRRSGGRSSSTWSSWWVVSKGAGVLGDRLELVRARRGAVEGGCREV